MSEFTCDVSSWQRDCLHVVRGVSIVTVRPGEGEYVVVAEVWAKRSNRGLVFGLARFGITYKESLVDFTLQLRHEVPHS